MTGLTEISKVISEGIKYLNLLTKTSHVRKLRKAIGYAQTFMELTEDIEGVTNEKTLKQLRARRRYIKRKFMKLDHG